MSVTLIADIGSSSGKWACIENQDVIELRTDGFNPATQKVHLLSSALEGVKDQVSSAVTSIYYYGSGIIDDQKAETVRSALSESWPEASIHITTDLVGAAIGMLGDKTGLIGILGTGSNCGYFDGKSVSQPVKSLGYPLGDEGSGWRIGADLIRTYYYQQMPAALREAFSEFLPETREDLLAYLKASPSPNRYLATYTEFARENINDPWIKAFLEEAFSAYLKIYVSPYDHGLPLSVVGGVAHGFQEVLRTCASTHGIVIQAIAADPMQGLIAYHQQKSS